MSYEQICAELMKVAASSVDNRAAEGLVSHLIECVLPSDRVLATVNTQVRQLLIADFKLGQDWLKQVETIQPHEAINQALSAFQRAAQLELLEYPLAAAKGHFYVAACYMLLNQVDYALISFQRAYHAALNVKSADNKRRTNPLSWYSSDKPLAPAQHAELEKFLRPLPQLIQHLRNPVLPSKQVNIASVLESRQAKISFNWVKVPAGEFIMGSNDYIKEQPIHPVYLPDYYMMREPVTNLQWAVFLRESGYNWQSKNEVWQNGNIPMGKEQHPVVYVSWHDAMAFCQWTGVSLPSEAEWEKAARGTDGRTYPWGNDVPTKNLCNFNNYIGTTTAIGDYPQGQSPYGLLDMAGNTWEWTRTIWDDKFIYPYKIADGREDITQIGVSRVLRGGSWNLSHYFSRTVERFNGFPTLRDWDIGLRCVQYPH